MSDIFSQPDEPSAAHCWCHRQNYLSDLSEVSGHFVEYTHRFENGKVISREADPENSIFVILDGWVSLSKSLPNGQTQIIDFGLQCDVFDLSAADGRTAAIGMEAITDTTVAIVPRDYWASLVQSFPDIAALSQGEAAAVRSRISERMLRLGRGNAEERIAYAFLELGIRTGALLGNKPNNFHLPLTQQQIGDFIGLTSVHVCRTIGRMARDGLITSNGHLNIDVQNVSALEVLAGITVTALGNEILF